MSSMEYSIAKCPYWKQGYKDTINCEGIVKRQIHSFKFQRIEDRCKWGEQFCCNEWDKCPWAAVLNKKYE